jgi:hypothetical protein
MRCIKNSPTGEFVKLLLNYGNYITMVIRRQAFVGYHP